MHATPSTGKDVSASVIEHKRHVSVAVELIHSDKKKKKSKTKKLYSEDRVAEKNFVPQEISNSKQISATVPCAVSVLRSSDHTLFTAEPHPLLTSADLSSYSNNSNSHANSYDTNVTEGKKSVLYGKGRLSSGLVGVARGVMVPDEDHEYFSELVDNINKKRQYPSVSGLVPPVRLCSDSETSGVRIQPVTWLLFHYNQATSV